MHKKDFANSFFLKRIFYSLLLLATVSFCFVATSYLYAESTAGKAHYIRIDGEISPGMAAYLRRAIHKAEKAGAEHIYLGIDTFGGRVDSALTMVKHIEAAELPVSAYVEDKAWSAGALIALACQVIYMQEGSTMGSAAPVGGGGQGPDQALGEKHVSAIRAKFESLAEKNGYSPLLAIAMVDKDTEVLEIKLENDEIKLYDSVEYETFKETEEGKKSTVESTIIQKDKLLNLTAQRAFDLGLAKQLFKDLDEFSKNENFSPEEWNTVERTPYEKAVGFLTSAMVSSLLITLGLILLYLEFQNPGIGWAGVVGVISLGLVFGGHYLIDYADWGDMLLFAGGIVLIFMEIFVVPGFGVTGILGILCLIGALYMALMPVTIPVYPWDLQNLQRALLIILGSLVGSLVGMMGLLSVIDRIPLLNKLVLKDGTGASMPEKDSTPSTSGLKVGDRGTSTTVLRPIGKGSFNGKIYDVVSQGAMIEKGATIEILEVRNHELVIREVAVQ